jgi:hypothetical protein
VAHCGLVSFLVTEILARKWHKHCVVKNAENDGITFYDPLKQNFTENSLQFLNCISFYLRQFLMFSVSALYNVLYIKKHVGLKSHAL